MLTLNEKENNRKRAESGSLSLSQIISTDVPFTMAAIAIFAKLALVDDRINQEELIGLQNIISMSTDNEKKHIYSLYLAAIKDQCQATTYARQIFYLYNREKDLHKELLYCLFIYAGIDNPINQIEMDFLKQIAASLLISQETFRQLMIESITPKYYDEYSILGVTKGIDLLSLRKAYYKAVKKYHPDSNKNILSEIKPLVHKRLSILYDSYQTILKRVNQDKS